MCAKLYTEFSTTRNINKAQCITQKITADATFQRLLFPSTCGRKKERRLIDVVVCRFEKKNQLMRGILYVCVHVKRQQKLFIDYLNAKLVEALVAAAFFHVVHRRRVFARLERNVAACNLPLPRSNIPTQQHGYV